MIGIATLSLFALLGGGVLVRSSDLNWGKKVNCFVVDGTVVCPGCNYRAGLTCPRQLKNSQNCLISTTETPSRKYPTEIAEIMHEDTNSTEVPDLAFNLTTGDTIEIQKEPTRTPIDMALFLYRILGSRLPSDRYKRDLQQEEEEEELEICNWNGDCPCPLICCKTGPGCPKRCVMGIRLPPPWG